MGLHQAQVVYEQLPTTTSEEPGICTVTDHCNVMLCCRTLRHGQATHRSAASALGLPAAATNSKSCLAEYSNTQHIQLCIRAPHCMITRLADTYHGSWQLAAGPLAY